MCCWIASALLCSLSMDRFDLSIYLYTVKQRKYMKLGDHDIVKAPGLTDKEVEERGGTFRSQIAKIMAKVSGVT